MSNGPLVANQITAGAGIYATHVQITRGRYTQISVISFAGYHFRTDKVLYVDSRVSIVSLGIFMFVFSVDRPEGMAITPRLDKSRLPFTV